MAAVTAIMATTATVEAMADTTNMAADTALTAATQMVVDMAVEAATDLATTPTSMDKVTETL